MSETADVWKRCGSCKKPIAWGARHWICGVTSCNRARFQLAFCSLGCWDAHVPAMNHRNAWAEEATAPPRPSGGAEASAPTRPLVPPKPEAPTRTLIPPRPAGSPAPSAPTRPLIPPRPGAQATPPARPAPPVREEGPQRRIVRPSEPEPVISDDEVLIVASRLKQYIRDRSEMNTSAEVLNVLSEMVRRACDDAIEQAREDGRKTVMARDFK